MYSPANFVFQRLSYTVEHRKTNPTIPFKLLSRIIGMRVNDIATAQGIMRLPLIFRTRHKGPKRSKNISESLNNRTLPKREPKRLLANTKLPKYRPQNITVNFYLPCNGS
jgi:hypothetical protein